MHIPSLSIALACAIVGLTSGPSLADVAIINASVVDVERGTIAEGQNIVIEDGLIVEVSADAPFPSPDMDVFDAAGRYLIPGLWDSHVHVFSTPTEPETALKLYLINGVTGIRDMGALWPIAEQQALQARIEAGETLGPRLVLAGAWVDAAPGSWPGMFLADTPAQARAVVEQIATEGWVAVKSYSMLNEATYQALAQAATLAGLPLVGHVPEQIDLATALEAGQSGIEHFGRVAMACSTREAEMVSAIRTAMAEGAAMSEVFDIMARRNAIILDSWDADLCQSVLARMAAANMHVSPTLVVADFYIGNRPAPESPSMQMVPASVREAWDQPDFRLEAVTEEVLTLAEATVALDRATFRMAHDAGVPILASTDASFANPYLFHGFSLLDELDIYVDAGLSPREALFTATVAPARFFGLPDQDGTIAPGRRADLVLLDANPLDGLATLRRPRAVIVRGEVLNRTRLDALEADLIGRAN